VALALAAPPSVPVRSIVRSIQLGLVLVTLSCAEPTATFSRPVATAIVGEQKSNSYSINAGGRTVYVRLAQLRGEGGEPVHEFLRRVMDSADSAGAQRLVVDLRSIAGSDARLLVPLIKGVVTRNRFVREGGLYVVIGPNNFSPTQNAATLLGHYTHPIFVDLAAAGVTSFFTLPRVAEISSEH
jgi:hypothetical protein